MDAQGISHIIPAQKYKELEHEKGPWQIVKDLFGPSVPMTDPKSAAAASGGPDEAQDE